MITTKKALVIFLFLLLLTGVGIYLIARNQAINTELRRKRDADAYAIRNALVLYMQQHNGAPPLSLAELKFERRDVDPSPFSLFALGTRKGQLDQDVIAEAEQSGNGKHRIVIYADGTVRWE